MEHNGVQDYYPEELSYCYGCGRLNEHGHHVKSYWDGNESVARFTPEEYHIAVPGYVYGGIIASIIDCHGTGTAALASYRSEGRDPGSQPPLRFVTASLQVDYLKPTPLGIELKLRGNVIEINTRKVISEIRVLADGVITARGRVVAVRMPDNMLSK
jgi:acyl-coenzyme A thioesterase PaaI-like protein